MKYILMNKSWRVAEISIDFLDNGDANITLDKIIINNRMPLFIPKNKNQNEALKFWLLHRSIPESRPEIKTLLDKTNCKSTFELSLKSYCLSLTDHYWVRPDSQKIKWEDISFYKNDFSEDVGSFVFNPLYRKTAQDINILSPDCTTNGWLKKAWKIKNGKRYLIKSGSMPENLEPAVEVFASSLLKELNLLDFVTYKFAKINKGSSNYGCFCESFLDDNTDFVPAFVVNQIEERGEDESVRDHFVRMCKQIGIEDIEEYLKKMNLIDAIFSNRDRHMGNFGFKRNISLLSIIGYAPLFDNGASLLDNYKEQMAYNKNNFDQLIPLDNIGPDDIFKLSEDQLKVLKKSVSKLEKYLKFANVNKENRDSIIENFKKNVNEVEKWILNQVEVGEIEETKAEKIEKKERKKEFKEPSFEMDYGSR